MIADLGQARDRWRVTRRLNLKWLTRPVRYGASRLTHPTR